MEATLVVISQLKVLLVSKAKNYLTPTKEVQRGQRFLILASSIFVELNSWCLPMLHCKHIEAYFPVDFNQTKQDWFLGNIQIIYYTVDILYSLKTPSVIYLTFSYQFQQSVKSGMTIGIIVVLQNPFMLAYWPCVLNSCYFIHTNN